VRLSVCKIVRLFQCIKFDKNNVFKLYLSVNKDNDLYTGVSVLYAGLRANKSLLIDESQMAALATELQTRFQCNSEHKQLTPRYSAGWRDLSVNYKRNENLWKRRLRAKS